MTAYTVWACRKSVWLSTQYICWSRHFVRLPKFQYVCLHCLFWCLDGQSDCEKVLHCLHSLFTCLNYLPGYLKFCAAVMVCKQLFRLVDCLFCSLGVVTVELEACIAFGSLPMVHNCSYFLSGYLKSVLLMFKFSVSLCGLFVYPSRSSVRWASILLKRSDCLTVLIVYLGVWKVGLILSIVYNGIHLFILVRLFWFLIHFIQLTTYSALVSRLIVRTVLWVSRQYVYLFRMRVSTI